MSLVSSVRDVTKATLGLGNVDNTSDLSKPVSAMVAAAIAESASSVSASSVTTLSGLTDVNGQGASGQLLQSTGSGANWVTPDGSTVGLANVDNTSDANKPTFTSAAKGLVPSSGGGTTKFLRADAQWVTPDKTAVGLANVDNTTDLNKPVSNATTIALAGKAGTATFTSTANGLVPASGGGITNFLRADGGWHAAGGGGGGTQEVNGTGSNSSVFSNNANSTSLSNHQSNTGTHFSAVCIGEDAECSTNNTVAIGHTAKAVNGTTVAIGKRAFSLNSNSVSIGHAAGSRLTGGTPNGAIAIGPYAGPYMRTNSICIGYGAGHSNQTTINNIYNPANNYQNEANAWESAVGMNSIQIGPYARCNTTAIAIGPYAYAPTHSSFNIPGGYSAYVGTTLWLSSDDRLKHNEVVITDGLDVIRQITPKLYQKSRSMYLTDEHGMDIRDEDGNRTAYGADFNGVMEGPAGDKWIWDAGVIAQEMHQVLPDYVTVGDEDRQWSVNYNALWTYCLGAVKELDGIVQQQQSTIDALLARVTALEAA